MNILEFAINVQSKLECLTGDEFAKYFVDMKMECHRKYGMGLITSNSHGIEFFKNIIQYWEEPNTFPNSDIRNLYNHNFVKLLERNK